MTSTQSTGPQPAGMPAHLWDLARSDVRASVPERVRGAVANGANAPGGIRRVAARVAVTGAALGVPAAVLALGGVFDAPVGPAAVETPLDGGLDPAPATPGSSSSSGGGEHTGGEHGGFASATTTGAGDVHAGLGSTWHVQQPGADPGDLLTVQIYQDVTVTETADGMFVVDADQYIVVHDGHGNQYVFKEHYHVVVPDPPGRETDLTIHEHGFVHVVENPDGTFSVAQTDHGIDVLVGSDGDGRDEVGIHQDEHVEVTDHDHHDGSDVVVDLSERAHSTSDDTGDEATTTIGQDQVFDDGHRPPEPWNGGRRETTTGPDTAHPARAHTGPDTAPAHDPWSSREPAGDPSSDDPFGEPPADRGGAPGSSTPGGTPAPSSQAATPGGTAAAARPVEPAPLTSTITAAPAATAAWHVETGSDLGVTAGTTTPFTGSTRPDPSAGEHATSAPFGAEHTTPQPFDGQTPQTTQSSPEPFEPAPVPAGAHPAGTTGTGDDGTPRPDDTTGAGPGSTGTGPDHIGPDHIEPDRNTPPPEHESSSDPTAHHEVPPDHGHGSDGTDVTDHHTGTDDASALVS